MKIGAYAFDVNGDAAANLCIIEDAVCQAAAQDVRLLVFPECALSGYPPRNIPSAAEANWSILEKAMICLEKLSEKYEMCIVAGTISREGQIYRNSACAFMPGRRILYHKRALWGWDRDNFHSGSESGIFEFEGIRIGMRICYEVRFPEYFRELYRAGTDLNLLLFNDVLNADDPKRYDLIRAHIRTRAAENVCSILSVNTSMPFQTAPTGLYDSEGHCMAELKRGEAGLLVYNWRKEKPGFSQSGRMENSNILLNL